MPSTRAFCLLLLASLLAACSRTPAPPAAHEAYVWQRVWTPELSQAIVDSRDLVRTWRVLAAQWNPDGGHVIVEPDWSALARSQRAFVPVIRLHGDGAPPPVAPLAALFATWRTHPGATASIEIDYDCPTSRLDEYAGWIGQLRDALPLGTRIAVTALPAWLGAPAFDRLLAAADHATLQVHSVTDPRGGLFDADRALAWSRRLAALHPRSFDLALPAYGSRVSWTDDGRLLGVASEQDTWDGAGRNAQELGVDPREVARFIAAVRGSGWKEFGAFAWFRLPLAGDRRAWSPATWRAVVRGEALHADFQVVAVRDPASGAFDVRVRNAGNLDDQLPGQLAVPGNCSSGDALPGFTLDRRATAFLTLGSHRLRAQQSRAIGWVRCTGDFAS